MIVCTAVIFIKAGPPDTTHHKLLLHLCYDAESVDDAKRDFLTTDECLDHLNGGWMLQQMRSHALDMNAVISAYSDAANATLNAITEAVTAAANPHTTGRPIMTSEQYKELLAACMRKAGAEKEQEDREKAERAAGEGEGVLEDYQGIEGDS